MNILLTKFIHKKTTLPGGSYFLIFDFIDR